MPDPLAVGRAVGAACAVAALVVVGWRWGAPRAGSRAVGSVTAALVGAVVGVWLAGAAPRLPPTAALDRLLVVGLPLAVIVELAAATGRLGRLGPVLRAVGAVLLVPVLLHGSVHLGPGGDVTRWVAGVGAVLLALGWVLVGQRDRGEAVFLEAGCAVSPEAGCAVSSEAGCAVSAPAGCAGGLVTVVATVLALGTAGLAIPMAGYVKGGLVALVLAAALAGSIAGGGGAGLGGVGLAALFGIAGVGRFFGGLSTEAAALVCAAPLVAEGAGWLGDRLGTAPAGRLLRAAAYRLALAAAPLAAVLVHGWIAFERSFRPLAG